MATVTRAAGLLPLPSLLRSASAARLPPPPMIAFSLRTLSSPTRRLLVRPALKPTRPDLPTFQVRASRTESGAVSLGFRAPHFEVLSLHPLTLLFSFAFLVVDIVVVSVLLAAAGALDGESVDFG
ncbi:hypothetical protein GW17_00033038 [Ensete ventricosum]|nr:hypothetical protein GW17_00033038 [Ensete ventricosum]RZS22407.1 hypothetical protein BHM03_00055176 [Ensete ventricosum]